VTDGDGAVSVFGFNDQYDAIVVPATLAGGDQKAPAATVLARLNSREIAALGKVAIIVRTCTPP
jgi:hypothetical protein